MRDHLHRDHRRAEFRKSESCAEIRCRGERLHRLRNALMSNIREGLENERDAIAQAVFDIAPEVEFLIVRDWDQFSVAVEKSR